MALLAVMARFVIAFAVRVILIVALLGPALWIIGFLGAGAGQLWYRWWTNRETYARFSMSSGVFCTFSSSRRVPWTGFALL